MRQEWGKTSYFYSRFDTFKSRWQWSIDGIHIRSERIVLSRTRRSRRLRHLTAHRRLRLEHAELCLDEHRQRESSRLLCRLRGSFKSLRTRTSSTQNLLKGKNQSHVHALRSPNIRFSQAKAVDYNDTDGIEATEHFISTRETHIVNLWSLTDQPGSDWPEKTYQSEKDAFRA